MAMKVTATALVARAHQEMGQRLEAKTESGETIEVFIPARLFADLTEATQSFLTHSLSLSQSMGSSALVDVSNLALSRRDADYRLAATTRSLGTIGLKLTPALWQQLEVLVAEKAIGEIVVANLSAEANFMTDEARHYVKLGEQFAGHGHTNHAAGEYVSRFNPLVHSNTVEGFFSIFKRGMRGVYQHCAKRHLHRYLAEFDFRYSNRVALGVNDVARSDMLLAGVVGKRLTYLQAGQG